MVPELSNPAYRELIVRNYRLIYHLSSATVSVVRVIHGARDFRRAWGSEPFFPGSVQELIRTDQGQFSD